MSKSAEKFEDVDLQTWLGEESIQTSKQLARVLNVAQLTISEHLHALKKIKTKENGFHMNWRRH